MSVLLDTNIAIHLRDGNKAVVSRLSDMAKVATLCVPTLIELQAGLAVADRAVAEHRKAGIARLRQSYPVHDLDRAVVEQYGQIVRDIGFSRAKVFDRLIAATAIVHDLTLVTINRADFCDIVDLQLEIWPSPTQ